MKERKSSNKPRLIYSCILCKITRVHLWAYPVCHCWGASAPPGPWEHGPSWVEFPDCRCSLEGAAASPAQRPVAADAALAASNNAVAVPGDEMDQRAKARMMTKKTFPWLLNQREHTVSKQTWLNKVLKTSEWWVIYKSIITDMW